jgi:autoinducer 2-degrading protein
MYVAIVSIVIKAEYKEQFVKELVEVARVSVNDEPGCLRLDVIQDGAEPNRVWFYEVFKDRAAIQTHGQLPHFIKFQEATKNWREEGVRLGAGQGAANIWPTDNEWK